MGNNSLVNMPKPWLTLVFYETWLKAFQLSKHSQNACAEKAFESSCSGRWTRIVADIYIKLCLLSWFEFFRTIALLLGALRDLIVGCSKSSSASIECRREMFGRTNFQLRVVSLGINISSTVGDDGRRTGERTEQCRLKKRTPRHYSLDFSTSNSFVYTDLLN